MVAGGSSPIRSFRRRLSKVRICSNKITLSLAKPYAEGSSIWVGSLALLILLVTAAAMAIACIRSRKLGTRPEGYYPLVSLNSIWGLALFFAVLGLTLVLAYTGETPFIYAQF